MRPSYFLVCALLSPAVIGCSDSFPLPPNVPPPEPTAVHINSGVTPLFVAYRDGFDTTSNPVPWTVVTPPTKMVTFKARDMYSVAVVCPIDATTVLTWQTFRTVSDDVTEKMPEPMLDTPCQLAGPALSTITGTATGPGFVHVDADDKAVTTGAFTLSAADGTYDFVASDTTAKKALITRNFVVSGPTAAGAAANAGSGMALVMLTPSLANPPPAPDPKLPKKNTETVLAQVEVLTKNNSTPATVFTADFNLDLKVNTDQVVTVFGIPDAMLTKDDTQNIKFIGTNAIADTKIKTTRTVTMPFAMGDDVTKGATALAFPSRLATATVSPGWGVDDKTNRLSVALPSLPALDDLTIETSGTPMSGTKTALYELHITAGYLNDTTLARPLFDTGMTGFSSDWTINFKKAYSRDITTQHDTFDDDGNFVDHETSVFHEDVDAAAP
jgi:hypothetical protein